MSEQDLRALDWAEEMWAAVIHETRDSGIAVAARYVGQSVSRQVAEAVAAERERCARMLEARARVMLEAWGDYMYGHSNAKHRADSARAETLCEAAAAIRAGEQEE